MPNYALLLSPFSLLLSPFPLLPSYISYFLSSDSHVSSRVSHLPSTFSCLPSPVSLLSFLVSLFLSSAPFFCLMQWPSMGSLLGRAGQASLKSFASRVYAHFSNSVTSRVVAHVSRKKIPAFLVSRHRPSCLYLYLALFSRLCLPRLRAGHQSKFGGGGGKRGGLPHTVEPRTVILRN